MHENKDVRPIFRYSWSIWVWIILFWMSLKIKDKRYELGNGVMTWFIFMVYGKKSNKLIFYTKCEEESKKLSNKRNIVRIPFGVL